MNFKPNILATTTVFFILGILLCRFLNFEYYQYEIFGAIFILLPTLAIAGKKKYLHFSLLILTSIAIGITCAITEFKTHNSEVFSVEQNKADSTLYSIEILKSLNPSEKHRKYEAKITSISNSKNFNKVLLYLKTDDLKFTPKVGDLYQAYLKIKKVEAPKNPYEFNYKAYLKNKHIYYKVFLNEKELEQKGRKNSIFSIAYDIKEYFSKKIDLGFKKGRRELIKALFLGDKSEINKNTYLNFSKSGVIHVLAISGLHLGIIILILNILFSPLHLIKRGSIIKIFAVLFFLWSFTFVTGLNASTTRAACMFSILLLGQVFNRKSNSVNSLIFSALILLSLKPSFIYDIGFQLSYVAVLSIIFINPLFLKFWMPKNRITRLTWQTLTVCLAAQIGVFPICIFYFNQFPGLFLISNLLIVPVIGIILFVGLLFLSLATLNLSFKPINFCVSKSIDYLKYVTKLIANLDDFTFNNIHINIIEVVCVYVIIIMFFYFFKTKKTKFVYTGLTLTIAFQITYILRPSKGIENRFIVYNTPYKTTLAYQNGSKFKFYSSDKISNYLKQNHANKIENFDFKRYNPKIIYKFKNDYILTINDKNFIPKNLKIKPKYILLSKSPKVNLERIIDMFKPEFIISDASNYSYLEKTWKKTCNNFNSKFYSTKSKGAFIFK